MKIYLFDACALIAYLTAEEGKDVVGDVLRQASKYRVNTKIYMHKINLLEVYYQTAKKCGEEKANDTMETISEMPIEIIDGLSNVIFRKSGILKSKYKMSLADSVAVAESALRDGILVTSDHHELEAVERGEGVKILWFR